MSEAKFNIELLPDAGKFLITLTDGKKIKGRFSMYALDRFCEKKELNYLQAIGKITLGMKISEYAELVLIALEDYYREDFDQCAHNGQRWTVAKVMDEILDPMGLGNKMALDLFMHAVGRLGAIIKEDPVKKKEMDSPRKKGARQSHSQT